MADLDTFRADQLARIGNSLDGMELRIGRARAKVREEDAFARRVTRRGDAWYAGTYGVGHGCAERVRQIDGPPTKPLLTARQSEDYWD